MAENTEISITHSFTYKKRSGTYRIDFHQHLLTITDICTSEFKETIKYTDIYKVKSGTSSIRIVFKDRTEVRVPCTLAEIREIQHIFSRAGKPSGRACSASALVEFGEKTFFVDIPSTDYTEFCTTVIRRIAKFFFPAYGSESISLKTFGLFAFSVRCGSRSILLEDTEDLEAAIRYCKGRLKVVITKVVEP